MKLKRRQLRYRHLWFSVWNPVDRVLGETATVNANSAAD